MTPKKARSVVEDYLLYGNLLNAEEGKAAPQHKSLRDAQREGAKVTAGIDSVEIECAAYGGVFIQKELKKAHIESTVSGLNAVAVHVSIPLTEENQSVLKKIAPKLKEKKEDVHEKAIQQAFDAFDAFEENCIHNKEEAKEFIDNLEHHIENLKQKWHLRPSAYPKQQVHPLDEAEPKKSHADRHRTRSAQAKNQQRHQ